MSEDWCEGGGRAVVLSLDRTQSEVGWISTTSSSGWSSYKPFNGWWVSLMCNIMVVLGWLDVCSVVYWVDSSSPSATVGDSDETHLHNVIKLYGSNQADEEEESFGWRNWSGLILKVSDVHACKSWEEIAVSCVWPVRGYKVVRICVRMDGWVVDVWTEVV